MKQFLLLLCLAVFTGGLSAQVYVNSAAADGGDGTTWATAYNSLSDALTVAPSGAELWVAAGTYTTPADSSFFIDKELTVLGGFDGTEAAAVDANPAVNATILSGDVMGNDGETYDSLMYSDNHRVLRIVDTSSVGSQYTVTLDGLTITNGGIAADEADDDPSFIPFSGGGIFSSAKLNASRLIFNKNRANYGSAISLIFTTASESVLDSLTLDNNYSSFNRQFYVNSVDAVVVKNSTFNSDPAVEQQSGFIRVVFVDGFTVENCAFSNMNSTFTGPSVRADESDDVILRGSTFDNLTSSRGGAAYLTQSADFVSTSGVMDEDDFVIDGCTITNCNISAIGGGITTFNCNLQVKNTTFANNNSDNSGGAIWQQAAGARSFVTVLDKNTFTANTSGNIGGALTLAVFETASVEGTINSCNFIESETVNVGSAMYLQGNQNLAISNTLFDKNLAPAGSIYMSGLIGLTLNKCDFTDNGNADTYRGAAVTAFLADASPGVMVDSSTFIRNSITERAGSVGGGGVMFLIGGGATAIPLTINNSLFEGNGAASDQAGGVFYMQAGFDMQINNSEFLNNSASGDGGVLSTILFINSRDSVDGEQTMVNWNPWNADVRNSKFINSSSGTQGGAIATQRAGMDFTNCVFVNNLVGGAGSGGAIIFNGLAPGIDDGGNVANNGELQIEATFVGNTFVDNFKGDGEGAVGGSLALFQPGDTESTDSSSMKITLTNNVFLSSDQAPAIEVELGDDEPGGFVSIGHLFFESLGGNYFNGENGIDVDLGDNGDVLNEDIDDQDKIALLFIDILDDADEGVNAQLSVGEDMGASNPLIDGGVINALTTDTDIDGFPRGVTYDIGAYEVDGNLTETNEPVENSGLKLTFFPNPTIGELNIQNDDASISTFKVVVSDQAGRILQAANFNGTSNRLDFSNLPMGVYNLQLYVNGSVYSKQIVKQ